MAALTQGRRGYNPAMGMLRLAPLLLGLLLLAACGDESGPELAVEPPAAIPPAPVVEEPPSPRPSDPPAAIPPAPVVEEPPSPPPSDPPAAIPPAPVVEEPPSPPPSDPPTAIPPAPVVEEPPSPPPTDPPAAIPPAPVVEEPPSPPPSEPEDEAVDDRADERERMVAYTIAARGVRDPLVLAAMRRVPRHLFMPEDRRAEAYEDRPVPIGWDQTISQPYIVASMTEEARVTPDSKVLEIGTGSGYQAAVLAAICDYVFSIEIKEPLAQRARKSLDAAGFDAVTTMHGDGYHGWKEHAPFDAIIVTAAAPHVPPPLVAQLAKGGRMVIPVGPAMAVQDLMLVTKDAEGRVRTKSLYRVRFVPLTGAGTER